MRFRDELVGAFRGQADTGTRRYVLRQLLDLPLAEAEEIIETLREEEARLDSPLAPQATTALGWLIPLKLAADHGWDPLLGRFPTGNAGSSATVKIKALSSVDPRAALPTPGSIPRPPESEAWVAAGSHLLDPCLDSLIKAAKGDDPWAQDLAIRTLSRLLHPDARATLEKLAAHDARATVALAQTGDPLVEKALLEAIDRPGAPRFDLVRLLGHYPGPYTARRLEKALVDPDPEVRVAAGLALEGFEELDPASLAKQALASETERWPLVHIVESLGRSATPDIVPRLIELHDRTDDLLVKVTVVLACSNLGGAQTVAFFLRLLESAPEPVQAEALECLVLQLHPIKELRDTCVRFLDSEYPQLALHAAIVLAKMEPELTTRKVVQWLSSPAKSLRLRGAHLLGYLRSENALRLSVQFANQDPAPAVRLEMLRGLSRYAPPEAVPALLSTLSQSAPPLRARAIALWSHAADANPDAVSAGLRSLYAQEHDPYVQVKILELLGQMGDEPSLDLVKTALAGEDEVIAGAAARALAMAGDSSRAVGELQARAKGAQPNLRGKIAAALWALGDLKSVEMARTLLGSGGRAFDAGVGAIDDIAMLLPRLPGSPKHQELGHVLNTHVRTKEYERFSSRRLGMASSSVMSRTGLRKRRDVSELELSGTVDAISTAKLKDVDVKAVVRGARTDSRRIQVPPGLDSGRFPAPPGAGAAPWQSRVGIAAVLCGLLIGLFSSMRPGGSSTPALGRGMAPVAGFLVLGTSGEVTGGPLRAPPSPLERNQMLGPPFAVTTGKDGRLTGLIGLVPDDQVLLGAGCTFVVQKLHGEAGTGHFVLEASASGGECLLELMSGSPEVQLEVPGGTLEARACRISVRSKPDSIVLKVSSGQVTIRHAGVATALEVGRAYTWNPSDGFSAGAAVVTGKKPKRP